MAVTKSITNDEHHFIITSYTWVLHRARCCVSAFASEGCDDALDGARAAVASGARSRRHRLIWVPYRSRTLAPQQVTSAARPEHSARRAAMDRLRADALDLSAPRLLHQRLVRRRRRLSSSSSSSARRGTP